MKTIATLIVLFLLTGCGAIPKTEVVTKEVFFVVETPKDMLKCDTVPAPPDIVLYSKPDTDFATKEKLLTDYGLDLLSALRQCQVNMEAAGKFQREQIDMIRKTEKKANDSKGI